MLEAFTSLSKNFSVLWSLHKSQQKYLGGLDVSISSIRIEHFVPQYAVLQHPNVKAMLSHGGMNSVTEALSAGKPLLVIPFFADQPSNADRIEELGCGIHLSKSLINDSLSIMNGLL